MDGSRKRRSTCGAVEVRGSACAQSDLNRTHAALVVLPRTHVKNGFLRQVKINEGISPGTLRLQERVVV